jgi:uncharacterized protein
MKLQADHLTRQHIHAQGDGWISINGEKITHSVMLSALGERLVWPCPHFQDINASHFEMLLDLKPELVIFGSGLRQRFVHPSLYNSLIQKHIGLETMNTAAACRTYNILAQEGRHVVAALLLGENPSDHR